MSPGPHRNSAGASVVGTLLEDSVPNNGAGLHLRCTFRRSPTNPPAARPPTSWTSKWPGHPRSNEARFPERMQCAQFHGRVPGKSGARKPGRDCTSSYARPWSPRRGGLDFLSLQRPVRFVPGAISILYIRRPRLPGRRQFCPVRLPPERLASCPYLATTHTWLAFPRCFESI